MPPDIFVSLERPLVVVACIVFAVLGYRLYTLRFTAGASKVAAKTALGEFMVTGSGPGLFFMAFSGVVLMYVVSTSGYSYAHSEGPSRTRTATGAHLADVAPNAMRAASGAAFCEEFASSAASSFASSAGGTSADCAAMMQSH